MTESEKQQQAAHDFLLEQSAELLRDAKKNGPQWRLGYYNAAAEILRAANAINGLA